MRLLIIFLLALLVSPVFADDAFYFVQVTDIHYPHGGSARRLPKIISSINRLPFTVEFIAVTGDITSETTDKPETMAELTNLMAGLKKPVFYLPGNHDILTRRASPMHAGYTNFFGPLSYSTNVRGVNLVFFYDSPLHDDKLRIDGFEPFSWLTANLTADKKPKLLFIHNPPVIDFYNNKEHDNWKLKLRDSFNALVSANNVQAVFAGHFHRDELHYLGGVPLYVAPSVADFWGRQASYRVYRYDSGRLSYRTVYIEDK